MAKIELKGLSKVFGRTTALHPLNLSIENGSFTAVVGPSGCGKSTLLNLIAGLEQPTDGDIFFDGESVMGFSPKQRDVAFVFQDYALYPHKTVFENIAFPLMVSKTNKGEIADRVNNVVELLGIETLLDRKPKELSGGQRQRVALGRAIIRQPKVFLLDEPLSNLDARLRVQTRTELKKLHRQLKTTFIYVTHDQTEAMSLSDTIAVLNGGLLLQTGSPQEIYDRPADTFVGSFMGNPGMNFIKGVIGDNRSSITINNRKILLPEILKEEGEVNIGLRPEHILLTDNMIPESFKAVVHVIEPLGSEVLVEVQFADEKITLRVGADFRYKTGDIINIYFNMEKANFFNPLTGRNINFKPGMGDMPIR